MDNAIEPEEIPTVLSDADFERQLRDIIPHLRAFARSLSGAADRADDLVQDAMLNAWNARKRFHAGTNFKAWMFVILRNLFLSGVRRARFTGEWDETMAERALSTAPGQDHQLALGDVQRALMHLTPSRRDALILVGAGGFSYEEAAQLCNCPVGTIKSRVARARTDMERLLSGAGNLPPRKRGGRRNAALDDVMRQVDRLSDCAATQPG
ncbi:sigma-70 family RNA polymerase sigma factor [Iodidimonas sp. SYSU 1G8]|uniref:sigma-70 family RNA polymerase sigma factor n=1 Tax=Iodidimonas sp. SYSU 1G8 TaxID=3133967 RepID=UPI0031FE44A0